MRNSLPISVLIRPRVQRWSPANLCASGPFPSSSSSRAHCRGDSLSRDTGPRDRSAAIPSPACRHRRTVRSVTRRSAAISGVLSPRANRPAASSRNRSRRCCSAGVYPPRCAYRMLWSYDSARPASLPLAAGLYELKRVSLRLHPSAWQTPASLRDLGKKRARHDVLRGCAPRFEVRSASTDDAGGHRPRSGTRTDHAGHRRTPRKTMAAVLYRRGKGRPELVRIEDPENGASQAKHCTLDAADGHCR